MRWPWSKREMRAEGDVTTSYVQTARLAASGGGDASLSATVATCAGVWTRAFGMLKAEGGVADALTAEVLSQVGADLFWRGESCWHIRYEDGDLALVRAAAWDEPQSGRFHLTIPRPEGVEVVKALAPEVLRIVINPDPNTPWRGRSPIAFMGQSLKLMSEFESTVLGALPYAGKGLLPIPSTIPADQQGAIISGLRTGALSVVKSKADMATHTGGDRTEFKRVELTPDLQRMQLPALIGDLHSRILGAAGIPPGLLQQAGNSSGQREVYRLFALSTIAPLAAAITPELTRKLRVDRLSIDGLMSADVAGRARAVSSLVQSGVPLQMAMMLVGWEGVNVPNVPAPAPAKPAEEEE